MFGKKKDEDNPSKESEKREESENLQSDDSASGDAPPLKPFSRKGSHAPAKPPSASGHMSDIPRRSPDLPSAPARRIDRPRTSDMDSRRLIVGRDIQLSGEITACDKLVVEGHVEVALPGARVLEIAQSGFFKGSAEVDEADISGRFEGELIWQYRAPDCVLLIFLYPKKNSTKPDDLVVTHIDVSGGDTADRCIHSVVKSYRSETG